MWKRGTWKLWKDCVCHFHDLWVPFSAKPKTSGSSIIDGFMVLPGLSYCGGIRGPQTGSCVKSLWYLNTSGRHGLCHMKLTQSCLKQEESEPQVRRRSRIWKGNLSGPAPLSHSALPLAVVSENAFNGSLSVEVDPKCLEEGKMAVAVSLLNIQQN